MKKYEEIVRMENTCAAYGEFDSVHKGHLKIAKTVAALAKEKGLTSVLVSCPAEEKVLTTEREKEYLLKDTGIEAFISVPEGRADIEELLETLGIKVLVVGENHRDLDAVKEAAEKAGAELVVCEPEKVDGEIVTASRVKEALEGCEFEKVTELCGHAYIMIGEVMHGKALGRTVGMPTANLGAPENKIYPPSGVYGTAVTVEEEKYKAMTNIGKRPSVDDFDYVTIEAFLLDFSRDIYGKEIILEVYKFVRGVIKFDNLAEVQKQVQKDIQTVRDVLEL